MAEELGTNLKVVENAIVANQLQKERMVKKLFNLLENKINGKTIAILGLAFKAQTDDPIHLAAVTTLVSALMNFDASISKR